MYNNLCMELDFDEKACDNNRGVKKLSIMIVSVQKIFVTHFVLNIFDGNNTQSVIVSVGLAECTTTPCRYILLSSHYIRFLHAETTYLWKQDTNLSYYTTPPMFRRTWTLGKELQNIFFNCLCETKTVVTSRPRRTNLQI